MRYIWINNSEIDFVIIIYYKINVIFLLLNIYINLHIESYMKEHLKWVYMCGHGYRVFENTAFWDLKEFSWCFVVWDHHGNNRVTIFYPIIKPLNQVNHNIVNTYVQSDQPFTENTKQFTPAILNNFCIYYLMFVLKVQMD